MFDRKYIKMGYKAILEGDACLLVSRDNFAESYFNSLLLWWPSSFDDYLTYVLACHIT